MDFFDVEHSSSSSDEELFEIVGAVESIESLDTNRVFRERPNPFEKYSDPEFRTRYRFYKDTVRIITNLIEDNISPMTLRNHSLSAADQLLITLRFYATGAFQIDVGDDYGVHKSTVCRIVQRVSECLAGMRLTFVKMPETHEEKLSVKAGFYALQGFPNVVGCVGGTHVPIASPGGENVEIFLNSKNYFSINVQAVCDSSLLIRDIDVRWPGSMDVNMVWDASLLNSRCEAGEFQGSYILGDSGYVCRPYLLAPLLDATTQAEQNYNTAHEMTRNCIKRCFDALKRRFACLGWGLRTKLDTSLTIIMATVVLHNIAVKVNDPTDDFELIKQYEDVEEEVNTHDAGGGAVRRALIDTVFRT